MAQAAETASDTGQPTVVDDLTTETTQVVAQPSGGFTLTSYRAPVRVDTVGGWQPVNDTLTHNADGTLSPIATPADLRFSGGGTGPMVTFGTDEGTISLTWPNPLPAPSLDGDAATYANVLPGVDLNLIASAEGYKQLITVKSAEAAANPALDTMTMAARADGLRLTADAHGALTATSDDGQVVLAGPRPYQWDASISQQASGEAPTDEETGTGQVNMVDVDAAPADGTATPATTQVQIAPDLAALRDPDTVFPVRIDPSMSDTRDHYLTVQSGGWNYYDNTSEPMRVGKCYNVYGECSASNGVARSYFSFNTSAISDQPVTAKVFDARVIVNQIKNASCGATPVALYTAGAFTSATTWNGPDLNYLQYKSSAGGGCGAAAANIQFDDADVDAHLQYTANNDYNNVYFGLISSDETNWDYWKKFSINPKLEVDFDFPPNAPTGLTVADKVACAGKPVYTRSATPTLSAQAHNNNPGYTHVDLMFQVHNSPSTGSAVRYNPTQITVPMDQSTSWATNSSNSATNNTAIPPTTPLPNGPYALKVQSQSASPQNADLVAWSGWYYFTIEAGAPTIPTITSYDYPADNWGAPRNFRGTFNLASSTDTAFYSYAFDGTGLPAVTDTTCAYTATSADKKSGLIPATIGKAGLIPAMDLPTGYHSLTVRAYDNAHNASGPSTTYSFYVAPSATASAPAANPNRFEAEGLVLTQSATQLAQTMSGYSGPGYPVYNEESAAYWSGAQQSHVIAPSATVPSAAPPAFTYDLPIGTGSGGSYALGVRLTTIWHYAKVDFLLDGSPIAVPAADTYSAAVGFKYVNLGEHYLSEGTHTMTVRLVDKNVPGATAQTYNGTYGHQSRQVTLTNAVGYSAGIDFFTAARLDADPFPTLAAAFNNDGVTLDTGIAGNLLNTSASPKSLSETALAAATLGAGQTKTINLGTTFGNVAFTRPAAQGALDNVIAMGQTITVPATTVTTTTAVHLLVTSSCGTTPTSPANSARLKLVIDGEELATDHDLPAVPDWLSTTTSPLPTVTLPSYKSGSTTTTGNNRLFVISATPFADTIGANLTAVTLPDLTSSTLPTSSCSSPSVHVLAMAVQP